MGRLKDKRLFDLLHDYFSVYLPNHRSASEHTLRSYRKAVDIFLEFLKQMHGVSLFEITFDMISHHALQNFAVYLSDKKHCSASTCSQRMACLKSFLKFCSECDSTLTKYYLSTDGLAVCSNTGDTVIDYLSEKTIRLLIEQPDPGVEKGQRDMFFYDTALRYRSKG